MQKTTQLPHLALEAERQEWFRHAAAIARDLPWQDRINTVNQAHRLWDRVQRLKERPQAA